MPPVRRPSPSPSADSDSDNDAPIAIPHTQAKRAARTREAAREQVAAEEREKRKEKNRERDRKLKERSGWSVRCGRRRRRTARCRVRRTMRKEKAIVGEDDDEVDDESAGDDNDDEDEEMSTNPNHLPDHLFTSAFASTSVPSLKKPLSEPKPAKRKRTRTPKAKDVVVGSRTIRVASTTPRPVPATLPSAKIRKFTDRALALKGKSGLAQRKGWSRMPAHLGSLRRSLQGPPAAGFVRNA
ncbi:hypothetical protein MVEN_00634300 [Mycena venus]|uniref:Uncharacterized protein n=1 Tax=Mycena venus TaxID=2733690 RepID=A0A8H7D652_9AGAR|nr:hypothetical protein MVEN_00634300 [Mycena venus]